MAGRYDTTLEIGDDWQRAIDVVDADGNAVDLTGYVARWQFRERLQDGGAVVAELSSEGGEIVVAGSTITASLRRATTAEYTPGIYAHTLEVGSAAGVWTTYLAGRIVFQRERMG